MTIILKLQGLDVKAGTEDIRKFFKCLHIPDGGVYIVGGHLKEAFIAFTTERDAQLAMRHNGNFLKGAQVTLHLSSMRELEHKLELLLTKKKPPRAAKRPPPSLNAVTRDHVAASPPPSTALPLDANTVKPQISAVQSLDSSAAFLLGVCTVLQGLQSSLQRGDSEAAPTVDFPKDDGTVVVSDVTRTPESTVNSRPGYVRLFGLPASATKEDICHFFRGLAVQEAIVNVKLGLGHGCLVKFENTRDASEALHFNQKSLGSICVEVRGASEKMWTSALQECDNVTDDGESTKPHDPLVDVAGHNQKPTSALQMKRLPVNKLPYKSPKKSRLDCDATVTSSPTVEHIVMVSNISKMMTKTEIKELFGCPDLARKNVLHLLDKEHKRTDKAFLIFNRPEDFDYAINLTGCHVGFGTIEVSSITKEKMRDMIVRTARPYPRRHQHRLMVEAKKKPKQKSCPVKTPEETQSASPGSATQKCLFVRNMPADVKRSQIKSLFCKYKLRKDNITILRDSEGRGIGEAVVQFESEKLAALALRLHGRDFLGTQVILTRIDVKQMEDILARSA